MNRVERNQDEELFDENYSSPVSQKKGILKLQE